MKNPKKKKINWKIVERVTYIILIITLVIYGLFKDSEAAATLIRSISEAFSILFN